MKRDKQKAGERRVCTRFVRRAIETDANLLASLMHRYAQQEGTNWQALAEELECDTDTLDQIALCFPPREDRFNTDVQAISEAFGVDPARLGSFLRRITVLEALSSQRVRPTAIPEFSDERYLLAARDRDMEPIKDAAEEYLSASKDEKTSITKAEQNETNDSDVSNL